MSEASQQAIPNSAAISDNGCKVLIGDSDGDAVLCEFCNSNPLLKFKRPATTLFESEDGYRIHLLSPVMNRAGTVALLSYTDGLLYLADLVTGQLKLVNSPDFVRRLVLEELPKKEADAARLRGEDRMTEELKEMISRRIHTHYGINHAILTPDGRYAVTSRDGEAIRAWDIATGECVKALPVRFIHSFKEGEVQCMVPMPNSEGVVFVTQDGRIHVWCFVGNFERFILPREEYNTSPKIGISADGKRVVFGGWFEPIEVWDILERRLVKKFDQKPDALAYSLAISHDSAYIIVASGGEALNNEIVVWDMALGTVITVYPVSSCPAHLSKLSEDGRFVCITDNGEVHYLSLENARLRR